MHCQMLSVDSVKVMHSLTVIRLAWRLAVGKAGSSLEKPIIETWDISEMIMFHSWKGGSPSCTLYLTHSPRYGTHSRYEYNQTRRLPFSSPLFQDDASALDAPTMRRWNILLRVFLSEYLHLKPGDSKAPSESPANHARRLTSELVSSWLDPLCPSDYLDNTSSVTAGYRMYYYIVFQGWWDIELAHSWTSTLPLQPYNGIMSQICSEDIKNHWIHHCTTTKPRFCYMQV